MAYALGSALAHLAAAAVANEAFAQHKLGSPRQGCRDLGGGVEAAQGGAQGCGWDGDDRAAQECAGREPMNAVGHQLGDRKQAAELEGRDQVSGHPLVCSCRPGSVESRGFCSEQGLGIGQSPRTATAENRLWSTAPAASGAERWDEDGG